MAVSSAVKIGMAIVALGGSVATWQLWPDGELTDSSRTVVAEQDTIFPVESLVDWVSFADLVAVVEITGEREGEPFRNDSPSYGIPRTVDLTISRTLWSSSFPDRPALDARQIIEVGVPGWWVTDGEKLRIVSEESDWPEVGQTFVAVLTFDDEAQLGSSPSWIPLALLPVTDDVVELPDVGSVAIDDVAAALDGVRVPDVVARHRDLAPYPRLLARRADLPRVSEEPDRPLEPGAEDPAAVEPESAEG